MVNAEHIRDRESAIYKALLQKKGYVTNQDLKVLSREDSINAGINVRMY